MSVFKGESLDSRKKLLIARELGKLRDFTVLKPSSVSQNQKKTVLAIGLLISVLPHIKMDYFPFSTRFVTGNTASITQCCAGDIPTALVFFKNLRQKSGIILVIIFH